MKLQERYSRLAERERKLLHVFGAVFSALLLVLVPILVRLGVSSQAEQNERIIEVIQEIVDSRVTLGRKQAEQARVDARYGGVAPPLAGLLAKLADQVQVEIPETQDRSVVPHGKTFKERSTRISLKKVGLLALTNFMEKLEDSGYPVSITRLDIKKRDTGPDQYDVEMQVSAFDREEKKPVKAASASAATGEPPAPEDEE